MHFMFMRMLRSSSGEIKGFRSILKATNVQQAERSVRRDSAARNEDMVELKFVKKAEFYEDLVPPEEEEHVRRKQPSFKKVMCEYCKAWIPRNGAAQFSHLKRHAIDLYGPKIISKLTSLRDIKKLLKKRRKK